MSGWIYVPLILLLMGCVIYLINRQYQLKKQIEEFRSLVDGICQGNYNLRFRPHHRENKVQELGASLNKMMDQVQATFDHALKLEEERKQMIAHLSHDLRTPLTSLLGYVEALQDDESLAKEEKIQYLQIIAGKGAILSSFIQQFFELARLEFDTLPLKPEKINIYEKIQEILLSYYYDLQKADLTPEINMPDQPVFVLGEEKSLERILQNLLINVIRYGKEGKIFGISLEEEEEFVRIEIWDKGPGISEKDLPHVFSRFYTGEHSRNPEVAGTGLGLAIVKILVEKMHGKIQVKSEPFVRTSFILTLRKAKR